MLKVAVIGVGTMGKHHARVYSSLDNCELVAVSDVGKEAADAVASQFSCKSYTDYREMLEKENIQAVSIAVPTKLHFDVASYCINHGLHVLIEKPITLTVDEGKKLVELAKEKGITLTVGHIERFNPAVIELKKIVDKGDLGEINSVIARRVGIMPPRIKDANILVDLAVHDIDIISYLLGEEPVSVSHSSGNALLDTREDHAELFLQYSKASGFIQANWITPIKIRTLAVTGDKGYAEMNYMTQELNVYESTINREFDDFGDFVVKFGESKIKNIAVKKEEPLMLELKNFVDAVINKKQPVVTGEQALKALEIAVRTGNHS